MAKPTTIKIRLNSTADTGHFYVTKKNARTMTEKMTVRKYDPVARKHVEYKEGRSSKIASFRAARTAVLRGGRFRLRRVIYARGDPRAGGAKGWCDQIGAKKKAGEMPAFVASHQSGAYSRLPMNCSRNMNMLMKSR